MDPAPLKEHIENLEFLAARYKEVVTDLRRKAAALNYPHDLVLAYAAVLRELREIRALG
jgi:hypothetical protein